MRLKSIAVTGVAAACLVLAACGGGGGGGGGLPVFPLMQPPPTPPAPPPPPPPGPAPAPAPEPESSVRVVMYETLKLPNSEENMNEMVRQFNSQGERGYRFVAFGEYGDEGSASLYVKDSKTTYSYEQVVAADSVAALREQLRAQGLRGYRPLFGDVGLYYKDNAADTTYSYIVTEWSATPTADAFLTELNAKGVNGYYPHALEARWGGTRIRIFEKDDRSNAAYAYAFLDKATGGDSTAAFLAQLNAQGAKGFRLLDSPTFSDGRKFIYEKDATQSAKFSFYEKASDDSFDFAKLVVRANEEGKKGASLAEVHGEGERYFTTSDCKGRLCDTRQF